MLVDIARQKKMEQLTQMVARAEKLQGPTPTLSIEQYPETVNNIIGSWLAKGIDRYHIELFCNLWMCNHPHLNARAPYGNFDRFMGYIKSNITGASIATWDDDTSCGQNDISLSKSWTNHLKYTEYFVA